MGIAYLREPGVMEAIKVISFHATPTSVMLTFGKNAGGAYPPTHPTSATPMRKAAESTNFQRLRLRPANIDSDSNSDSASTPA